MSEELRFSDDDDMILSSALNSTMDPEWKPREEDVESSRDGSQLDGRKFYVYLTILSILQPYQTQYAISDEF